MRAVIQHVGESKVEVEGEITGQIEAGLLVLLGVMDGDTDDDLNYIVERIVNLRLFERYDEESGKHKYFDVSVKDAGLPVLLVSQFTLCANLNKGRRPSFDSAAKPNVAIEMYKKCIQKLQGEGIHVEEGQFQAMMHVHLVNKGPITIWLDSKDR